MDYKTILVHCDTGRTAALRARIAIDFAGRFDAHVTGVYVRPRFEAPIFSDGGLAMDALYRDYEARAKADEAAASAAFTDSLGGRAGSTDWRVVDGYADEALAELGHGADLIVVGQAEPDSESMSGSPDIAERLALHSERPLLVVPHIGTATPPGKTVLLCWNGRREAGRAASGALPLLAKAESVTVLVIDPPNVDENRRIAGDDVVTWLTRHGVKASLQRDSSAESDIGNVILSRAADCSADLVVMGIYGHSRLREMVMGGASRTVLSSMTVPLLIAH
jgi:nucleotide-binding universal stress UspA family protein